MKNDYCYYAISGKKEQEEALRYPSLGLCQWQKLFGGTLLTADESVNLTDSSQKALFHIFLGSETAGKVPYFAEKLKEQKGGLLVLHCNDPGFFSGSFDKVSLEQDLAAADLVLASEFSIAKRVLQIKRGLNLHILTEPCRVEKLPALQGDLVLYIPGDDFYQTPYHEKNYLEEIENFKELAKEAGKEFAVALERESPLYTKKEIFGSGCLAYSNEDELTALLARAYLCRVGNKRGNRELLLGAKLGIPVMGPLERSIAQRCFPFTTKRGYDREKIVQFLTWPCSAPGAYEHVCAHAKARSEYYNPLNIKERFLGLLPDEQAETRSPAAPGNFKEDQVIFRETITPVRGVEAVVDSKEKFGVVSLVKNGMEYLPDFMDHYRALGTSHFFFIDNGSTDLTVSFLMNQEDVTLYRTDLPFNRYESDMRRYIIEKHFKNSWCLCVDSDEFFDYPHSGSTGMESLLSYLNSYNYTAMVSYMLDMFSTDTNLNQAAPQKRGPSSLQDEYRHYDLSAIQKRPYFSHVETFCNNNTLRNREIQLYYGGIRRQAFYSPQTKFILIKHPLFLVNGITEPVTDRHYCNNAQVADISGVLKHYKLTSSFKSKVQRGLEEKSCSYFGEHEYRAYSREMDKKEPFRISTPGARELQSTNELVKEGFIHTSLYFDTWVEKARKRKARSGQ